MNDGYEYFQFIGGGAVIPRPGDEVWRSSGGFGQWSKLGDIEALMPYAFYRRKPNPNVRLESKEELLTQQHAQNWLKVEPFLRDLLNFGEITFNYPDALPTRIAGWLTSWRNVIRSVFAQNAPIILGVENGKIHDFIATRNHIPADFKGHLYSAYVDGKHLVSSTMSVLARDLTLFGKNPTKDLYEQCKDPAVIDCNQSVVLGHHGCRSFYTQ